MNPKWTEEEIAIIEEMACLHTVKQIAYRLKIRGYTRSISAIQKKLRFLGYSARPILDNYNCCEIARVLQLNSATVWTWVKVRIQVIPKSLQSFADKGFRGLVTTLYSQ